MGGSYGSINFRTSDRDAVLSIAEAVARERSCQFWCGPPLDGWVTIYPSGAGQDESIAADAASHFRGEIFYVAVHDDDIFFYRYFSNGALVDAFWSAPGYFGEQYVEAERAQSGDPSRYAHLVRDVDAMRQLLDEEEPTFEVERLIAFGERLGIANLATSYEYLDRGERDDIRGFDDFVHIPDRRAAEAAAKECRAAEHEALLQSGRLLAFEELSESATRRTRPFQLRIRGRARTIEMPARREARHPDGEHRVVFQQRKLEVVDQPFHHPDVVAPWLRYFSELRFLAGPRFAAIGWQYAMLQFFVWRERAVVATVIDPLGPGASLSFSSEADDGTTFFVTNRAPNGLDEPPGRTVIHLPGADAATLLDRFLAERPMRAWKTPSLEELPGTFQARYAAARAWRSERGYTEEEAARFLLAQKQQA